MFPQFRDSLRRANFIKPLGDLARRQLVLRQQIPINTFEIARRIFGKALKSRAMENAQSIIDMLHPRGPLLLVVREDASIGVFDVAGLPLPRVAIDSHQALLAARLKRRLHRAIVALEIGIAVENEKG